ncbi:magnesium transporter CorA family protein [Enterococcus sp. BWB1-3]|uniref:magnesium transporter CorA family protein n=1 Tax=unclassified Enterococcus TaxID=2608891 RepID=UPI0019224AC5|nr:MULTISPECIES: magnesium transporter CorA family protein [unclassified Enterococcus]MBL1227856.1 magnesium transporter CorA family protein [Enterococcus sp. BWB1-3]MCB5953144.1 magnesium transporter CorA family protein [Enterococcus sp. BWT-B8]MCB5956172.1 magnesium transporter CorA family protein [Enterococcus sp. CWB-B31]
MITYLKKDTAGFSGTAQDSPEVQWIIAEAPTKEEADHLISTYELPKDYITSVLDEREMARSEGNWQNASEHPALILVQYPIASLSPSGYMQLDTFPCAVIQAKNEKLITVTNRTTDFINEVRTENLSQSQLSTKNAILFQLLWRISKHYNSFLAKIITEIGDLEGELKIATENSQLYQMMDIQKSLVYFESAISENISVIRQLYDTRKEAQKFDHLPHLHDILVEMKQALTTTKIQLKLVNQISSTFSSIVSNNLNIVMKILTSLTIVLTIPTIIGGIYGMNVKLPFASREDAFLWIFIITSIVCIGVIRFLKKRNLL